MGRETAVDQLSPEHLEQLKDKLEHGGFRNYQDLTDWLQELGYQISRSSVHRFGQKYERQMQAVSLSTQTAVHMMKNNQDDAGALSATVMTMLQSQFFDAFMKLQAIEEDENPLERIEKLAKIGKGVSEVTKASITQKKWQVEIRDKARAELLAEQAEKLKHEVKANGLSDETADLIRAKILGIAE